MRFILSFVLALSFPLVAGAQERGQIHIVGSSTVFPFSALVAEEFGRDGFFPTPIVESTGTGGGLKLLCAGKGVNTPDISNASRRIKDSEVAKCAQNGVSLTEVKIGYDGIVLANNRSAPSFALTRRQIFMALAARVPDAEGTLIPNPYRRWSDLDRSLPSVAIRVLGPPPTSGTRDAFVELAMEAGARTFGSLAALRKRDKKAFKAVAHALREDGAYVEAGENDNLIVRKLVADPSAVGIFGFSFLEANRDKVKGLTVDGVRPTFANIAQGKYGIARSLFFYVKREHLEVVPGLWDYVYEFTREDTWGDEGYLADKGLIPLQAAERKRVEEHVLSFPLFKK